MPTVIISQAVRRKCNKTLSAIEKGTLIQRWNKYRTAAADKDRRDPYTESLQENDSCADGDQINKASICRNLTTWTN